MLSATEYWYRAKKAYSLYPGVVAPISGQFLSEHYARRRRERSPLRVGLDAAIGIAFLAWVPVRARFVQRRYGFTAAWRKRAVAIARATFCDPNDIALFRIDHPAELANYIRRFEDAALNKQINPRAWTSKCALADKIAFYRRCSAYDLPHPEVFATITDGQIDVLAAPGDRALLIKPSRGEGGAGVEFVEGAPHEPVLFSEWLRTIFRERRHAWLVQHRIKPHADLRDLALNALPTARMTTILDEAGRPQLVSAVLRIPSNPSAAVDNMKAGGLLSPIDLVHGTLGPACKGYGGGDYDAHPVTGAAIPGRQLPDWALAQALVKAAHIDAFSDYGLVGWDVGFAPDGPILIEGNGKPGVLMPQRAARRGLGEGRYGELLAHHLALDCH